MNQQAEQFIQQTGYDRHIVERFLELHPPENLYCKCGSPKMLRTVNNMHMSQPEQRLGFYCGSKECHPRYGIARPEHAEHMRMLAQQSGDTPFKRSLIKPGEQRNRDLNTTKFKRTKLMNLGFDVENLGDAEIETLNSQWESDKARNPEQLAKRMVSFINRHDLRHRFPYHTVEQILSLDQEVFDREVYRWRSWHHSVYCADTCGAKHFRREVKTPLVHNTRGRDLVVTRSSYEANYIDFFEDNQIPWDHEPLRIQLELTTYTPDFLIEIQGRQYLLEVKGYLLEENRRQYLETKINGGFEYAQSRGWGFIFTYEAQPGSIRQLLSHTMKEKF